MNISLMNALLGVSLLIPLTLSPNAAFAQEASSQLPPLSLGPPPCSLDNPDFSKNLNRGICPTNAVLRDLATLPAPPKAIAVSPTPPADTASVPVKTSPAAIPSAVPSASAPAVAQSDSDVSAPARPSPTPRLASPDSKGLSVTAAPQPADSSAQGSASQDQSIDMKVVSLVLIVSVLLGSVLAIVAISLLSGQGAGRDSDES